MAITNLNLSTAYIADLFAKTNEVVSAVNQVESAQSALSADLSQYKDKQVQVHFERDLTQSGLSLTVFGGHFLGKDGLVEIPDNTFTLNNNADNYISIDGTNFVLVNATSQPADNMLLYKVTVSGGVQTEVVDYRTWAISSVSREEALEASASDSVAAAIALGG